MVGDMDSGLTGFLTKKRAQRQVLSIPRNWPALGGAVPSASARPQMFGHQEHMVGTGCSDSSCLVSTTEGFTGSNHFTG